MLTNDQMTPKRYLYKYHAKQNRPQAWHKTLTAFKGEMPNMLYFDEQHSIELELETKEGWAEVEVKLKFEYDHFGNYDEDLYYQYGQFVRRSEAWKHQDKGEYCLYLNSNNVYGTPEMQQRTAFVSENMYSYWGSNKNYLKLGKHEAYTRAREYCLNEMHRLRGFYNQRWSYLALSVEVYFEDELVSEEHLSGIESDMEQEYLIDTAAETFLEAWYTARKKIEKTLASRNNIFNVYKENVRALL